jgi:hypothetical protein
VPAPRPMRLRSCSFGVPAKLQCFDHAEAGIAGRLAFDPTKQPIALPFIETRGLKGYCVENCGRTSTLSRLGFSVFNYLRADPIAAQCLGQEEQINEEKTQRSSSKQASNNPIRIGVDTKTDKLRASA